MYWVLPSAMYWVFPSAMYWVLPIAMYWVLPSAMYWVLPSPDKQRIAAIVETNVSYSISAYYQSRQVQHM